MPSRVLQKGVNTVTQPYSAKHKAVDIGRSHLTGEPIIAHSAGKVVFCQTGQKNNKGSTGNASYGNCIKLDHGDGYATLYAHLASVKVTLGESVEQGQVIGTMGNTGNSYGTHLHFEVRQNNTRIDPTPYLEADLSFSSIPSVVYKGYTNRWLPAVTDYNEQNSDGYAGIHGRSLTALTAIPEQGVLRYRVHLLKEKRWLPWAENDDDYAGNLGEEIDAVQMELRDVPDCQVRYRVSPKAKKGWYRWCVGLTDSTGDGYAGVFGKPIDCIQLHIVRR